jgi:ABC-type branched-subunit amino acid transport system ATPase component
MSEPILRVEGLNVYYGGNYILRDASMRLDKGVVTIIGRNGMGKSTFVKAIMGLVPVYSGSISFLGVQIAGRKPYEVARLGIGYVPQGRGIFPSLSVDEHLRFAARNTGEIVGCWDADRVYGLFPQLKKHFKQQGSNLSGGEQQMLAIGRALVTNPTLLIMDEPSEGLAPIVVQQLKECCIELAANDGLSIVLVEQSLSLAEAVSDHTCVMVTGKFEYSGSLKALLSDKTATSQLLAVG